MGDNFVTFFQQFPEAVALVDANGRIIYSNLAFQALVGADVHDVRLLGVSEDFDRVKQGEMVDLRERMIKGSGEREMLVHVSLLPLKKENGCMVVLRDRTEIKRLEVALEESEKRFRLIAEHSSDYILILSNEQKVTYISPSFVHMFGIVQEESETYDLFRYVHRDDVDELQQKLHTLYITGEKQTAEFRRLDPHGQWVWMEANGKAIFNEHGELDYVVVAAKNISERKKYEEKLHQLAYFDSLTGIANRSYFERYIRQLIHEQTPFALCYLDFDKFKWINDHFSHQAGDYFLQEAVKRVQTVLQENHFFARIGGDEFVLLLPHTAKEAVSLLAERLIQAFHQPFRYEKQMIQSTLSVGIAFFPSDADNQEQLMKYADQALYYVKDRGKNGYHFYQPVHNRTEVIKRDLPFAIIREQFYLCYQPKIELGNGSAMGVETLLRWRHPTLGEIPPLEFIPLAEKSGFIFEITLWVLEQACRQVKEWQTQFPKLKLAVNLSPFLLNRTELVGHVIYILNETGFAPEHLILEVTESGLMENIETGKHILTELKTVGVQVAIDDFGTGFSSLAYIRNLPVTLLKIDRSFIQGIAENSKDATIVDTIIHLAKSLDIQVLAEGVETNQQLSLLQQMHCDFAQGFYFSKSLEAEKLKHWLEQYNQSNAPSST